jgi:UDP-MurNAc hydroxylase
VDKSATVLLPAFELDHLERALPDSSALSSSTEHAGPVQLGAEVAHPRDDGPGRRARRRLCARPRRLDRPHSTRTTPARDLHEPEALGPFDAHYTQFSGAIWYLMVYDFRRERRSASQARRPDGRAMHYLRGSTRRTSSRSPARRAS